MAILLDAGAATEPRFIKCKPTFGRRRGKRFGKGFFDVLERDAVLRPLGAGQAGHDRGHVEG